MNKNLEASDFSIEKNNQIVHKVLASVFVSAFNYPNRKKSFIGLANVASVWAL